MKCGGGSHPHCVKTVLNKCQTCTQNISYTNKLEDKSFGYKCDSESDKKKKEEKKEEKKRQLCSVFGNVFYSVLHKRYLW